MRGLEELREATAEYLQASGVDAVTAWSSAERVRRTGAVAVVSLRGCEGGPAGFRDYLGERYDPERKVWEELYGRRAELTLGLDLYAPKSGGEAGCAALFAKLSEALADGRTGGAVRTRAVLRRDGIRFPTGPVPVPGRGGVRRVPLRRRGGRRNLYRLYSERDESMSERITSHERPGVYSRYEASSVVRGGAGKTVALLAKAAEGDGTKATLWHTYTQAAEDLGSSTETAELVRLLFRNGASAVYGIPVSQDGQYTQAIATAEQAWSRRGWWYATVPRPRSSRTCGRAWSAPPQSAGSESPLWAARRAKRCPS